MKMRKLVVAGVILLVLLMVYLFSGYNNGSNDAGNDPQRRTVANAAPLAPRPDNPAPHDPAEASSQENGPRDIILREKAALVLSVVAKETLEPIAGAVLEIETQPTSTTLVTDGEGFCELSGLEPGMLRVSARADGFAKQITFVNILPATANAAVLYLGPAGEVHVYTVDPDGNPVPDVLVEMWPQFTQMQKISRLDRLFTNEEGYGVFKNVPRGPSLCLQPALTGDGIANFFETHSFTFGQNEDDTIEIMLTVTRRPNIDLARKKGTGWLRGRIIDSDKIPVPLLRLDLEFYNMLTYEPEMTDERGEFEFTGLNNNVNALLYLSVSGPGYKPIYQHLTHPGEFIELEILPSAKLQGRIIDSATSSPIQSFTLSLISQSDPGFRMQDDRSEGRSIYSADGSFVLDNIYPEEGTIIRAYADGYGEGHLWIDPYNLPDEAIIALTPRDLFRGIVVDADTGQPVSGAFVGIWAWANRPVEITPQWKEYSEATVPLQKYCSLSILSNDQGMFYYDINKDVANIICWRKDYGLQIYPADSIDTLGLYRDYHVIPLSRPATLKVTWAFPESQQLVLEKALAINRIWLNGMSQDINYPEYEQPAPMEVHWDYVSSGHLEIALRFQGPDNLSVSRKQTLLISQLKTINAGEAASLEFTQPLCRLFGQITQAGKPVQCTISLRSSTKVNADHPVYRTTTTTDAQGNYETPWIGPDQYEISIRTWPFATEYPQPAVQILGNMQMDYEI